MQTKTGQFVAELEAGKMQELRPKSFELYEEYSRRPIADTIRTRMENFNKADLKAKRELLIEVGREVIDFSSWLEETKNLEHTNARYYSVSLKSMLLGLPVGVQIAQLFSNLIDISVKK